jgi:hypothetical protein
MCKVNKKTPDFHSFLGFFAEIGRFYWFLACFAYVNTFFPCLCTARQDVQKSAQGRYFSPNSTLFFGASAAAIGVFSASTTGAAILK